VSTRTSLRPQVVIPSPNAFPANSQDMSADIVSAPTILNSLTKVSYGVAWSGAGATPGFVSVEASDDCVVESSGNVSGGTWNTLPFFSGGSIVSSIPLLGASGNGMIDIETLSAYSVRLRFTANASVGNLTVTVNGKVA